MWRSHKKLVFPVYSKVTFILDELQTECDELGTIFLWVMLNMYNIISFWTP